VDKVNAGLEKNRQERLDYEKIKGTPEEKSKSKKYWDKMRAITQSQLDSIEFYGKVVDQYDNPISQVTIKYNAQSGYLAEGDGHQKTRTNDQGVFVIKDVVGAGLSVYEMLKIGHQFDINHIKNFDNFQRFPDSQLWTDYTTPDNPYIFKGWKFERYPKTKVSKEKGYSLTPDGRISTFDLLTKGKPFKKGLQEGDFTISFDEVGENWVARIESLAGGLIETDDLYINLAPETGYQTAVTYQFPIGLRNIEVKNYYLKMRDGYYGRVKVEYRAYPNRKGKATVYVSSVVNLEKGRNLTIKKQQ
jgi:hypothetical protein